MEIIVTNHPIDISTYSTWLSNTRSTDGWMDFWLMGCLVSRGLKAKTTKCGTYVPVGDCGYDWG